MRFVKRRETVSRPNPKADGVIIFQASTQNWRDRVKTLTTAQAEQRNAEASTKSK